MVYMDAKKTSYFVVVAAWLAVFCLFGYPLNFCYPGRANVADDGLDRGTGIFRLFADDEHLCHYSVL